MTANRSAADPQADVEPLRCMLEIDLGGTVSVTLLDACSTEDARYAAAAVARSDSDLAQLTVRHARTGCPHQLPRSRPAVSARQVNIYDAKSRLSRLITDIEHTGHGIVIARHGRPVAELVPLHTAAHPQEPA